MALSPPVTFTDAELDLMTDEELAFVHAYYCPPSNLVTLRDLWIADMDGNLIPLVLNPVQQSLMEQLGLDPDDPSPRIGGRLWRKRILKARREGLTTLILALYFIDTINNPNRRSLSIAHNLEDTKGYFDIVRRYHANLPPHKKRPLGRANERELYWPDIDSRFGIATAGRANVASGSTLHNVHKSERAKWEFADVTDLRRLDASIDEAGQRANIIEETTADGLNFFYEDWKEAERGEGVYQAIFFPWFDDPRYRTPVPADFIMTEEESERAAIYRLDEQQVFWYRNKKSERKELTPQEYPHTAEEAFVSTAGNHVFNVPYLKRLLDMLYSPEWDALEVWESGMQGYHGRVEIYEYPMEGVVYVAGADVAEGIKDGKHDESAFDILRNDTKTQVLSYVGLPDPIQFAFDIYNLCEWYNRCLVNPENNPIGLVTIGKLKELGANLYHGEKHDDTGQVVAGDERGGTMTTSRSKGEIDGELQSAIEDSAQGRPGIYLRSRGCVEQLIRYVHKEHTKRGGEGTAKDDRVRSLALAYWLSLLLPKTPQHYRYTPPAQSYGQTYSQRVGRRR